MKDASSKDDRTPARRRSLAVNVARSILASTTLLGILGLDGCIPAGVTTGIIASSNGGSGDNPETPPPRPPIILPQDVLFRAPFLSLEGTPSDVAAGDFVPDEDGHIDVAVITREVRFVTVFEGDGGGNLREHAPVPLGPNAFNPHPTPARRATGLQRAFLDVLCAADLEWYDAYLQPVLRESEYWPERHDGGRP